MDLQSLQSLCMAQPGTTQDIKWENHLCFNVGGKMFVVTSPDEVPVSASFKASDEDFESLTARPGCKPAAYLARHKWVYVDDIGRFTASEWERLVPQAYRLVREKLPRKLQDTLG